MRRKRSPCLEELPGGILFGIRGWQLELRPQLWHLASTSLLWIAFLALPLPLPCIFLVDCGLNFYLLTYVRRPVKPPHQTQPGSGRCSRVRK